jgi:hypothetical protein
MLTTAMKTIPLILVLSSSLIISGCSTMTPEEEATRRESDERRREQEERRHAQEDLRRRFARYTTPELKVMHARHSGLTQQSGTRDITINPMATKIWGTSDRHNVERLIEIERELLRRWQAGDADAKLPQFEPSSTSPPDAEIQVLNQQNPSPRSAFTASITEVPVPPNATEKFALEVVVQVHKTFSPFAVLLLCNKPIARAVPDIPSALGVFDFRTLAPEDQAERDRACGIRFLSPPVTTKTPVVITLFANEPFKVVRIRCE